MSFWDNVKKFTQPYSDEDYDDYEDEEFDDFEDEMSAPSPRRHTPAFGSNQESALDFAPAASAVAATPAPASTPAAATGFGGILNTSSANKQEVVLYHAKAFDDAAKAADELRNRKAVILNMENVDKALTRRVVDFLSGCVYALEGQVKKIAQSTYLFCPRNMDIVGDLEGFHGEIESYI